MLDLKLFAEAIKHMLARWYTVAVSVFLFASEAVSKLAAVVGQQLDDLDRAGIPHLAQEVDAAGVGLIGIDFHEDPAGRAIDGNEQVSPCVLVPKTKGHPLIDATKRWHAAF